MPTPSSPGLVDLRDHALHRDVRRLIHEGGSRVVYELLAELGQTMMVRAELEQLVRKYCSAFCRGNRQ